MKEQLECQLDDSKKLPPIIEYKWTIKTKIFIRVLVFLFILFLILLIVFSFKAKNIKDEKDDLEKEIADIQKEKTLLENERIQLMKELENNTELYIFNNMAYADENNPIKNLYKRGGINFIEELGEVNNGSDYEYTDMNKYDLYIPNSAIQKKINIID